MSWCYILLACLGKKKENIALTDFKSFYSP
jgi:hypothetical protein